MIISGYLLIQMFIDYVQTGMSVPPGIYLKHRQDCQALSYVCATNNFIS